MPKDKSGKFHNSTQRAMSADKMASAKAPSPAPSPVDQMTPALDADPTGDQPSGAASLAAMHDPGGKHMHISSDGFGGMRSSRTQDGGEPEGPHDHQNLEELKAAMEQFFNEEENEGAYDEQQDQGGAPPSGSGLY